MLSPTLFAQTINAPALSNELNPDPDGSIADVKGQLELSRLLISGREDDAQFLLGPSVTDGIAVIDASSDENHNISKTLLFRF